MVEQLKLLLDAARYRVSEAEDTRHNGSDGYERFKAARHLAGILDEALEAAKHVESLEP